MQLFREFIMLLKYSVRTRFFRSQPATARNEIIYAIGDLHGRFDLLTKLTESIKADYASRSRSNSQNRIIVLGDFIDRGPASNKLIRFFMAAQRKGLALEVLQGNHEALLLESILGDERAQMMWLAMGGLETLASFKIEPPKEGEDPAAFGERVVHGMTPDIIEWIRDRPVSTSSGDYWFCHAGVRPGVPLRCQSDEDMLWIRKSFMESDRDHGAVIVHGHNVVDEVEICSNRISLDTGACRSGNLSAICLDGIDRRILSTSPASCERDLQKIE